MPAALTFGPPQVSAHYTAILQAHAESSGYAVNRTSCMQILFGDGPVQINVTSVYTSRSIYVSSFQIKTYAIIHIHVKTRATAKEMKKKLQATLLQSSATRAPVATAFNLFIPRDTLTGGPRVIQKCSKGR